MKSVILVSLLAVAASAAPARVTKTVWVNAGDATPAAQAAVTVTVWGNGGAAAAAATPAAAAASPVVVAAAAAPAAAVADTSSSSSASTGNSYADIALLHHNKHRANHSAPALTYDTKLASYAATVAASCKFAHDLTPGGGGYGQNLAASGSSGASSGGENANLAASISNMWYNGELNSYTSYGSANPSGSASDWGHFTQVVWKSTTTVGCATQLCPAGTIFGMAGYYTVCNYGAAGNMGGAYGANVLAPLGQPTFSA